MIAPPFYDRFLESQRPRGVHSPGCGARILGMPCDHSYSRCCLFMYVKEVGCARLQQQSDGSKTSRLCLKGAESEEYLRCRGAPDSFCIYLRSLSNSHQRRGRCEKERDVQQGCCADLLSTLRRLSSPE